MARSHVLLSCLALCAFMAPPRAHAFKIGYTGIPVVVKDFQPVHEAVTAEAVRYFCETEGLENLRASRLYRALFDATLPSCSALTFPTDMGAWRGQMNTLPIADLLLGARYPDLREMAGIDADKQDVTVARFDPEVQIDSYRLYPQFHGQLSKYHNIWGGDQALGMSSLRAFTRAVLYEVAALVQSYDLEHPAPPNKFVAANAMLDHDTNRTTDGAIYEVRFTNVLLGTLFHSLEDGFSHDPLLVLDAENDRLVRGSVFYGRFVDGAGNVVEPPAMYPVISPDMAATMDVLSGYAPIVRYTPSGPLRFSDVPQANGGTPNWFEHGGKRFASGHMATTLGMYAVSEFLSLLHFAVENGNSPAEVNARVEAYLDRWFSADFEALAGYTPTRTQDVAAIDPEYAELPWWDYHFVDLWKQSGLADRTERGMQAFVLPWSDRTSMGDLLTPDTVGVHFVLVPGEREGYDEARHVYYVKRDTLYLFASWEDGSDGAVVKHPLDVQSFVRDGKVVEQELELDSPAQGGLDRVYASAFVPPGYRACFHAAPVDSASAEPVRTAAYDLRNELYRCFYGTREGRWVHINFHLRAGMRVRVLPIDADGDGVPFLRGVADDVYADNCPLVANADQADQDADGRGDACPCVGEGCAASDGDPGSDGQDGASEGDGTEDGAAGSEADAGVGGPAPTTIEPRASGCSTGAAQGGPGWLALLGLCALARSARRRRG